MRVRIRVIPRRIEGWGTEDHTVPRLGVPERSRGRFPLALAMSVALHLAGGAAAPAVWDALDEWGRPVVDLRAARMLPRSAMPLVVRMPEEPLLVRIPKQRVKPKLRSLQAKVAGKPAEAAPESRRRAIPLMVKREAAVATAVLLQPKLELARIEEPPDLRTLAVWTGRSPKPANKPVAVGSAAPKPERDALPKPTAPAWPSPEPVRSEIAAVLVAAPLVPRPKLVLMPSGSSPLVARTPRLEEPVVPPGSSMAGEAAAIVALSSLSARPEEVVPVPPGNVVVVGDGGAAGPAEGPKAERALPAVAAAAAAAPTPVKKRLAGGIQFEQAVDGTVSLTYPNDGQFDVVVVDAALPEGLGPLERSLTGRPVHTAYLNVGAGAEWVLQYCVAQQAGGQATQRGMVVTLDAPKPLKAPYVLKATLPAEAGWREAGYVVIHGMLSAMGRLEEMKAVRGGAGAGALMGALGQWLFRPASEGGVARAVEVLLVVPPRGGVKIP